MIALLLACGSEPCDHELTPAGDAVGNDAVFAGYDPSSCTPDEAQFDAYVRGAIEAHCGDCHGTVPDFGAPQGLLDYADLVAGEPGNREVDRIARRVAAKTMPPSGIELPHAAIDTLVGWSTCGEVHPDHGAGLQASQPVYTAPAAAPFALPSFDLVADGYPVDPSTLDRYQCFAFDVPVESRRFIRRMQVVVDESRVLHHVVLASDSSGSSEGRDSFECEDMGGDALLYAWAPGTDAFDFEEGGLPIDPGDRLVVQIHYNNGAGLTDVRDRSGIRIFHGPPEGTEWTMIATGPEAFEVPEGESTACAARAIGQPMRFLAGMPHMHQLGVEMHQYVERLSGEVDPVIDVTGYDFEAQRFYRYDLDLDEGDVLHTWCGYRNHTGAPQQSGTATSDEMCFHFIYAAPL